MRRWIIIVGIILVVGLVAGYIIQSQGGFAAFTGSADEAEIATPLPAVQIPPDIIVDAVVVPRRFAALSFSIAGHVDSVSVIEGSAIEAGDLIAQLQNERQVIAIAQAEARVSSARARLDQLNAGARPEEIQATQAGLDIARANLQILLEGSRQEDIDAAQANLSAAQANLSQVLEGANEAELISALADFKNAEANLRQAQAAYDDVKWRADVSGLPQAAQLQTATNNYEASQARYDLLVAGAEENEIAAAQAEVERARAEVERVRAPATEGQIAAAQAEVRRAEAELALRQSGSRDEEIRAGEADVIEAQTALMQRRVELADTELRAPFSGVIASLDLEVGEQVNGGVVVAQMADLSDWLIETDDLTEINVVYVQVGDRVTISIDALPELELQGTVIRIKPFGENKQGDITYTATIEPDTFDDRLLWNMTASVRISTDR